MWRPRGAQGVMAGKEAKRLTKAELIDQVTMQSGLKKKDVTVVVESVFGAISARLKKHEKVQIVGFGTFEPRRRKARIGRDPRTQEAGWGRTGHGIRPDGCAAARPPRRQLRQGPVLPRYRFSPGPGDGHGGDDESPAAGRPLRHQLPRTE